MELDWKSANDKVESDNISDNAHKPNADYKNSKLTSLLGNYLVLNRYGIYRIVYKGTNKGTGALCVRKAL